VIIFSVQPPEEDRTAQKEDKNLIHTYARMCTKKVCIDNPHTINREFTVLSSNIHKKVKQSLYTPWRRLGGEEYSSYSFTTAALDRGERSASRPGRALPRGKGPLVPIVQEAGWAPELVGHRG
jgi:hypothetical protein